jgi:hypothetical protein
MGHEEGQRGEEEEDGVRRICVEKGATLAEVRERRGAGEGGSVNQG